MAVEENNEVLGVNKTTQSTQSNNIPNNGSALVMSTRSIELEARYQELLERRILALEQQLASNKPAELQDAEAAPVTSGTDTKDTEDKPSSSDTAKGSDGSVDLGCRVGSKSHGRKTVMIYDELEQAWKPETRKAEDEATTNVKKDLDPETKYAFKFIEFYTAKAVHRSYDFSRIEIFSKELISILKETLRADPGQVSGDTEGFLRSPYYAVVYHWDKLMEQTVISEESHIPGPGSGSERARETREALADLLECIRTSRELKDYFKTRDTNIAKQVTSYKYLWTFFPPGTRVVASPFMGTEQLFLVEDLVDIGSDRDDHEPYWQIDCIYLDFDTSFGRRMVSFKVKKFDDTKPLKTLECYPTKFMDHEDRFLKDRKEQGQEFKTFCFELKGAAKLFSYRGNATSSGIGLNKAQQPLRTRPSSDDTSSIFSTSIGSNPQSRNTINVKGQVIIDHGAWNRWGPGDEVPNMGDATAFPMDTNVWLTSTIHEHSLHSIATKGFEDRCKNGNLLDDEYALLPPRLLGYIPVKRIFAQLAVKHLSRVEDKDKDQVWKRDLILDEDKKNIIRTLVENHAQMAHKRVPDLVEGKGNGLVILLHGPPGVGKSLTAECVAKATSKPLFTVGVADIGTDSRTVEDKLNQLFSLAAEWDAVLLIDEADVFMEQRGSTDSTLERNALVSVLLRVLEYYEGILILTTNRVLSFDVAVQSRIHLAVMFYDLDGKQTHSIIKVHLEKRPHGLSDGDLNTFSELAAGANLNGRQIRNVISSAEAMVNSRESKRITWDDIRCVLNHTKEFQQSLQDYSKQQRANNEAQGRIRRN